jgi:hypothetical protein
MATPSNSHAISAIRERLAEVSGELLAVEKQWRCLREAHAALSQTLRMFDPEADRHPVRPKRPYKRVLPNGGRKLSRFVLDALRASKSPMTASEIVAALGERADGIPDVPRRVRAALNYLARSGRLVREGKRQSAKWSLSSPNEE